MIKYFLDKAVNEGTDIRFERKTPGASGYDLMANIGMARTIEPMRRWVCHTGLYLEMPLGVEAQVRSRSGLCRDHGVFVLNAPGTVDSDYRGEICVTLMNAGQAPYNVLPGDRVAQLVFCPVFADVGKVGATGEQLISTRANYHIEHRLVRVSSLAEFVATDRGASGHGSTGR